MLTKLIDLGYVGTGTTPSMKNPDYYNSKDILFIKPSDINDNEVTKISESDFFISNNARNKARIFPKNTILCVCIGSIGKIGITTKESSCNQQINYIIPNESHDSKFLAYSLLYRKDELIRIGSDGPVVPIINKSRFENIEIVTFDKTKEIKIANELDTIKNFIILKQKEVNDLDELIKSRFIEMFENKGFGSKQGKELFKFSSGKFLVQEKRFDSGIPTYGGNGIAFYTDESLVDEDTIIIGRVGAYCGNARLVRGPKWITDNALYISKFKTDDYTLEFLEELMNHYDFHQYAGAAAQPKITQKPLEDQMYLLPPKDKQIEFTNFVKLIDKSKFIVQKEIKDLQELLDKKMDEYFG